MSHSHGAVKFDDGTIGFIEYNGTVDVVIPKIRGSAKEVTDHWRSYEYWECKCFSYFHEPIIIAVTYGGGMYWHGKACEKCMMIVDGLCPDSFTAEYGLPDWYPDKERYEY
jgi:hypothetical protein